MTPAERLEKRIIEREAHYVRVAIRLRYDYPTTTIPVDELYNLLMAAYREGGRDMHAAINDELEPLWVAAGIEP